MTERSNVSESRINSAALYLSASFFVVLGTINVVHNFLPLFRGAGGNWWPVILGMFLFGLLPLGFGCWLVWSYDDRKGTSCERNSAERSPSDKVSKQ